MLERDFNEVDLRQMMQIASAMRADLADDRWVIQTRLRQNTWEVIVEPDHEKRILVVVTAYLV